MSGAVHSGNHSFFILYAKPVKISAYYVFGTINNEGIIENTRDHFVGREDRLLDPFRVVNTVTYLVISDFQLATLRKHFSSPFRDFLLHPFGIRTQTFLHAYQLVSKNVVGA